ncbi:MAG: hypothetical protein ABIB71_00955 [Candidatus Woesearchaeota archaeon]
MAACASSLVGEESLAATGGAMLAHAGGRPEDFHANRPKSAGFQLL